MTKYIKRDFQNEIKVTAWTMIHEQCADIEGERQRLWKWILWSVSRFFTALKSADLDDT